MAKPCSPIHMQIYPQDNTGPGLLGALLPFEWFAVRTRPRHEKTVTTQLETSGIETFLPLSTQVRTWSDRRRTVDFPLFPGYVFVRTSPATQARARVFQARGVIGFVGPNNQATAIPAQQIEAVRSLLQSHIECRQYPFLNVGQRVRVQNGAGFQGLEGIFSSHRQRPQPGRFRRFDPSIRRDSARRLRSRVPLKPFVVFTFITFPEGGQQ